MRLSRVVAALAACIPGLAIADPVTVIAIGAQALAAGGAITAATAAWVGVGLAVFGAAKARTAQRRAASEARAQQLANVADRNYRPLTNLPPLVTIYGTIPVGGYIVDSFATDLTSTGADGVTRLFPDGLRHMVIVWAAHECSALHKLRFGEEEILVSEVGPDGWALPGTDFNKSETAQRTQSVSAGSTMLPVAAVQVLSVNAHADWQPIPYTLAPDMRTITVAEPATVTYTTSKGQPMLRMSHHLGADSQAVDAYLTSIAPTRYTAAHRLAGLCYSVLTFDLREERWQSGPPSPVAVINGKKLFDPRTGTAAFSKNPALMVLDYLRHDDGFAVEAVDIDMPSVIAAANACDQAITVPGIAGAQPQYVAGGAWETGQSREAVLDDLCRAMAGTATYAGMWSVSAGAYTPPVMTLTDDDLAGSISIAQAGAPDEQISNGMRGTYIPEGAVTASDIEPYSNAALVTADGGELWDSVDLPYTQTNWRARNIARILVETRRNGLVISYPAKRRALRLQPGDRVRVTSPEYGWTDKIFRATDTQIAPRQTVALTLQEDAPEAWDQVDASEPDPTPNTGLPSPWGIVPTVEGLAAVSGTSVLQVAGDGTIITRVRVTWDPVSASYATGVVVSWSTIGEAPTPIRVPADQTELDIVGPIDGTTITISAYVQTIAGPSDSVYIAHQVLGKSEPPAVIPTLNVLQGPGGSRRYQWTYSEEIDFKQFEARYWSGSTLPAWDAMNTIFTAGPGERSRESMLPPDGTHYVSMLAVDRSGNISARTTVQVTLSGDPGTLVNSTSPHATGWPGDRVDCYLLGSYLVPGSAISGAWGDPGSWASRGSWNGSLAPASSMSYAQTVDMATVAPRYVRVQHDSTGSTAVELCTSPDGINWTAWVPITSSAVAARHYQVRISLSGASAELRTMTINLYL